MDGEAHVRATAAVYAISEYVRKHIPAQDLSFAFLGTPSIATMIPKAAALAGIKQMESASWWQSLMQYNSGIEVVDSKDENGKPIQHFVLDAVISMQGPNYSLAKTLQLWSAVRFRKAGHTVSSNVAPACFTGSVVSNKNAERGLRGAHAFPPFRGFGPETAQCVMLWLLAADLRDANNINKNEKVSHPLEPFSKCAFHGGLWRMGFRVDEIGVATVVAGVLNPQRD